MNLKAAIRRVVWPDANLTELARDVARAFASLVGFEVVTFRGQYTEPLYFTHRPQPIGVFAMRVRETADPAAVVAFGSVAFEYDAQTGRVQVNAIDGMVVSATEYTIDFLVVN